jgi:hypothetical protein
MWQLVYIFIWKVLIANLAAQFTKAAAQQNKFYAAQINNLAAQFTNNQ